VKSASGMERVCWLVGWLVGWLIGQSAVVAEAGGSSGNQRKGNVRRWKTLPEDW
jgi:hypothetical protein